MMRIGNCTGGFAAGCGRIRCPGIDMRQSGTGSHLDQHAHANAAGFSSGSRSVSPFSARLSRRALRGFFLCFIKAKLNANSSD